MATTHPVRWLSSEMQGAPQHTKMTEGLLVQHLKALLVTGFGDTVADSVVYDTEKGLAKAAFSGGHAYLKDSVIEVSGATPADYNGQHLVTLVDTNNVWFELDTVPADATGTITLSYPSLGWSMTHESGDGLIAVFQPAGDLGEVSMRVDNSPYTGYKKAYHWTAKVEMVTDVVDINTFEKCADDYDHWRSSSDDYDHANNWKIVGDSRLFHWFTKAGYTDSYSFYEAGYIDSYKAGDRYHFITEGSDNVTGNDYVGHSLDRGLSGNTYRRMARKHHQLAGFCSIRFLNLIPDIDNVALAGVSSPNPVDNGFIIQDSPTLIGESLLSNQTETAITRFDLRGSLPHLREVLTSNPAYSGKVIYKENRSYFCSLGSCDGESSNDPQYSRLVAFDITPVEV